MEDFKNLKDIDELNAYMSEVAYRHSNFYHYTQLDTIDKILRSKTLRLTNVSGFNDKVDTKQFGKDWDIYFSSCFSVGSTENLSLWYLYSGIDGKGGRIHIPKSTMNKVLKTSTFELHRYIDNGDEKVVELLDGKNMKIDFRGVIYYQVIKDGNCKLKYNNRNNKNITHESFSEYKRKNIGFYKPIIWFQEREVRLLIELTGDAKELVRKSTKRNTDKKSDFFVAMILDRKIIQEIFVELAPEIKKDELEVERERFRDIQGFLSENVNCSGHAGDIEMKISIPVSLKESLCKKCDFKKV